MLQDDSPRTSQQNRRFHAMCQDLANQIPMFGDVVMDKEAWKRLVLGAHYGQKVVPNPFGNGVVVLNIVRSRDLSKSGDDGMSDLITQLIAFGNERGVKWSDEVHE